jgi:hypothetical protein
MERKTDTHIPIIALSVHTDMDYKKSCIETGIDAVFSKPLIRYQAEDVLNVFV